MGFISNKRKNNVFHKRSTQKDFAEEIVEIFEEKLEELNITLPGITKNEEDEDKRIKSEVRNELICEIEEFVSANKNVLLKEIA